MTPILIDALVIVGLVTVAAIVAYRSGYRQGVKDLTHVIDSRIRDLKQQDEELNK